MNREAWLTEMAARAVPLCFRDFTMPPYRVTCGWPCSGGLAAKSRRIGECHGAESSKSGHFEIFVSPVLDDPLDVAGTVCHELAHVVAGIEAAHGKEFVRVCRAAGLTAGKPRSVGPGPQLTERLRAITARLGPYPHAAIIGERKEKEKKPPTSTSVECVECGCRMTISYNWLGRAGPPTCGCGGKTEERERDEG